jgi:hypothetical protein
MRRVEEKTMDARVVSSEKGETDGRTPIAPRATSLLIIILE